MPYKNFIDGKIQEPSEKLSSEKFKRNFSKTLAASLAVLNLFPSNFSSAKAIGTLKDDSADEKDVSNKKKRNQGHRGKRHKLSTKQKIISISGLSLSLLGLVVWQKMFKRSSGPNEAIDEINEEPLVLKPDVNLLKQPLNSHNESSSTTGNDHIESQSKDNFHKTVKSTSSETLKPKSLFGQSSSGPKSNSTPSNKSKPTNSKINQDFSSSASPSNKKVASLSKTPENSSNSESSITKPVNENIIPDSSIQELEPKLNLEEPLIAEPDNLEGVSRSWSNEFENQFENIQSNLSQITGAQKNFLINGINLIIWTLEKFRDSFVFLKKDDDLIKVTNSDNSSIEFEKVPDCSEPAFWKAKSASGVGFYLKKFLNDKCELFFLVQGLLCKLNTILESTISNSLFEIVTESGNTVIKEEYSDFSLEIYNMFKNLSNLGGILKQLEKLRERLNDITNQNNCYNFEGFINPPPGSEEPFLSLFDDTPSKKSSSDALKSSPSHGLGDLIELTELNNIDVIKKYSNDWITEYEEEHDRISSNSSKLPECWKNFLTNGINLALCLFEELQKEGRPKFEISSEMSRVIYRSNSILFGHISSSLFARTIEAKSEKEVNSNFSLEEFLCDECEIFKLTQDLFYCLGKIFINLDFYFMESKSSENAPCINNVYSPFNIGSYDMFCHLKKNTETINFLKEIKSKLDEIKPNIDGSDFNLDSIIYV